ncbi:MAG: nicotinate (nicotinamide) nucleotide adenylyltransferase [Sphaerochaetaceae bacterium]|jgi:nicotinate-nucleotide adenylyltransferase|nr:nicotinate (nicotinamide) nucleotide adenylyltransferase [Sphaerochaetaceae bacterium]MDX9808807.1 nicotinate (nicotinamide) nucleotide adenylyltransferase [Sphaerochaetaceae bacterium]NLV83404.1 nicotinate (nicotinamide) nucleotide adenylyltransferase [Spirochaetales bacterium]
MNTAVLGGTFDPVHNGHLFLLHQVLTKTDYRRVIIVPTHIPPHKAYIRHVSDEDRLAMLTLAVVSFRTMHPELNNTEIIIDDCEIRRKGFSYMFDTVHDVYRRYAIREKLAVVIGDDLLSGLSTWYRFDELRALVRFLVFRREQEKPDAQRPDLDIAYISNDVLRVSSTDIRESAAMQNFSKLSSVLPQSVLDYIRNHGLYRN